MSFKPPSAGTPGVSVKTGLATGRIDRTYKFLAGVLRNYNDGAGWVLITDGFHPPIGIETVDSLSDTSLIHITYPSLGANRSVSLIASPDETLAKNGFHVGASVSPTFSDLKIGKMGTASDYLFWDGSQWTLNLGANSPFAIASSLSASNDILLTHATVDSHEQAPVVVERGSEVMARVGTVGADFSSLTQFRVSFYDAITQAKLTAPNTNCRAFVLRGCTPRVVAPADVHIGLYPNSNIWIWGVMQVEATS